MEKLSHTDKKIVHRNEQEIKVNQVRIAHCLKDIEELRNQNREILGRHDHGKTLQSVVS